MLNNLMQPHEYPGKLFVVEGIDGSGKTTQLGLLAKWLVAEGHRVFVTEWNSSALVKAATKTGKKKNALTPMTFSLLHATDFADRLLYKIIPPLKAGMIVLADRYTYTAFARDVPRKRRVRVTIGENDHAGFERRNDFIEQPIREVGGVQQAERHRCQRVLLLPGFRGGFDEGRRVPFGDEDAVPFGHQPLR